MGGLDPPVRERRSSKAACMHGIACLFSMPNAHTNLTASASASAEEGGKYGMHSMSEKVEFIGPHGLPSL